MFPNSEQTGSTRPSVWGKAVGTGAAAVVAATALATPAAAGGEQRYRVTGDNASVNASMTPQGGCGPYSHVSLGASDERSRVDGVTSDRSWAHVSVRVGDSCTGWSAETDEWEVSLSPDAFTTRKSPGTAVLALDVTAWSYDCDEFDCWSDAYPVQVEVSWTATGQPTRHTWRDRTTLPDGSVVEFRGRGTGRSATAQVRVSAGGHELEGTSSDAYLATYRHDSRS